MLTFLICFLFYLVLKFIHYILLPFSYGSPLINFIHYISIQMNYNFYIIFIKNNNVATLINFIDSIKMININYF